MPVDTEHPEFVNFYPKWKRCRDFLDGSDAVKKAGKRYLTPLPLQTDPEFDAYKERAQFFNASARTRDGLHGMVFRKPPEFVLSKEIANFAEDCTLDGVGLESYSRDIMQEVLNVGRAGTLIEWDNDQKRPIFVKYPAERIKNWRLKKVNGAVILTLLALEEFSEPDAEKASFDYIKPMANAGSNRIYKDDEFDKFQTEPVNLMRVFELVGSGESTKCICEVYEKVKNDKGSAEWVKIKSDEVRRKDRSLNRIPFIFHNTISLSPCIQKPPLDDLIILNQDHYRLSADHRHALHFTACPTYYALGFKDSQEFRVGATTAWISDNHEAKVGVIEYQGHGLSAFEKELDSIKVQMTVIGARLLEPQKKERDVARGMEHRMSAEGSILMQMVNNISHGLTLALRWAQWWASSVESPEAVGDLVLAKLNTDFIEAGIDPQTLMAIVGAWQAGLIDHPTALWNLHRGEMLPPGETVQDIVDRARKETVPLKGEPIPVE